MVSMSNYIGISRLLNSLPAVGGVELLVDVFQVGFHRNRGNV